MIPAVAILLAAAPASAEEAQATYHVQFLGAEVAELQVHFTYSASSYLMETKVRTIGLAQTLFSGEGTGIVTGSWNGNTPHPRELRSDSFWGGEPHKLVLSYAAGLPSVTTMVPADKHKREAIPDTLLRQTTDSFSRSAGLMRQIADTGSCNFQGDSYDGRVVTEVFGRMAGYDLLKPSDLSSFTGTAMRCEFEGKVIAGFTIGDDQTDLRTPKKATVWFARIGPDSPPVPVRAEVDTRHWGVVNAFIVSPVRPVPMTAAAQPPSPSGNSTSGAQTASGPGPLSASGAK